MSSLFRNCRMYFSVLNYSTRVRNGDCHSLKMIKNVNNFSLPSKFSFTYNRMSSNTDSRLSLANPAVRKYLNHIVKKYDLVKAGHAGMEQNRELTPLLGLLENRLSIIENISSLDELGKSKDIADMVAEEQLLYKTRLAQLEEELIETILSTLGEDDCRDVILEISAGVGGQEAMLFAKDLYEMYLGYLDYLEFEYELLEHGSGDAGGTRYVSLSVTGDGAYSILRHEAGVHRVQRIPATERAGRVHTSTVTVSVLPQPSEIEVSLLDRDLKIETKRASGAGGQHVNTTDSAVRIVHLPTGIAAECQTQRSQLKNKEAALRTLRARIYQQQFTEQQNTTIELRKRQRGLGFRNEKIRTYNYQQNRVTDHRIPNGTISNLRGFLEGGEPLAKLAESLNEELRRTIFLEVINEVRSS